MKSKGFVTIIILGFMFFSACAQKMMKLSDDLKVNSTPQEAKAKGIASISKYYFGAYEIISSKSGWITARTKEGFFFDFTSESQAKQKLSFVFVGNRRDTALVNIAVDTDFKKLEIGSFSELRNSTENYVAFLSPLQDSTYWSMAIISKMGSEIQGNFEFKGVLTDGIKRIEIKPVRQWADGKSASMKIILGYEFILDGKPLGAIQASLNSFHKKYIWLRNDLTDDLRFILATSAVTLLVMVEGQSSRLDD